MIVCSVCGSEDWFRCFPGTAPDARTYDHVSNVIELPAVEEPMLAYCWGCCPIRKGMADDVRG